MQKIIFPIIGIGTGGTMELKSMTGFGRGEAADDLMKITVEMKSVNHRYLDLGIKMPKKLNMYEALVRNVIKEYAQRGKVDIFVTYEEFAETSVQLKYNHTVAAAYVDIMKQMQEEFGLPMDAGVSLMTKLPEVITMDQVTEDESAVEKLVEQSLRAACEVFVASRVKEGDHLRQDLVEKLDHMLELVAMVEERAPKILEEYRAKLTDKVRELLADNTVDEGRILTEVAVFADKVCVDEETVRLKAHINNMKELLLKGGSIGRKLDFIAQEMNREANTTLSKCNDMFTSELAIELKTEIEKVREQIQNIE